MKKGDVAACAWTATEGSTINVDGGGQNISCERVHDEPSDDGRITEAFDGHHVWSWRNRGSEPISLSVRTRGTYSAIGRLIWRTDDSNGHPAP